MRILLTTLNSKYIHSNPALKYLYGVSAGSDMDITLREFTINNDKSYVYTEIVRGGYDVVCFSCYIWNIEKIKELAGDVKKARPGMKILLGGPEVSFEAHSFMEENLWADYIICGEGEWPFFSFCREIVTERNELTSVPGLFYRKGDHILSNPTGEPVAMDKIPFPYEFTDIETDKVIYYESSRGCPYRCSYCLSSVDKSIRALSMERTRRDILFFLNKNVRQVKFIDRTFNYDRQRAYDIWSFIMDNDNGVTNFHFEICAEILDATLIHLLSKARKGLFQLEIGIQTINEKALSAVNRSPNTAKTLEYTGALIQPGNIHIHVDLIAGLPFEDYRSFSKSFNAVYALRADNLQLGFLKLLKGTAIRGQTDDYGYVFRDKAPYEIISNDFLSVSDLIKLKMIETVLDLFDNKGGFEETIAELIVTVGAGPFQFYEQLADFYYSGGYQHRSHKKEDLYRILLRFAHSRGVSCGLRAKDTLQRDLEATMNFDAVKKFNKKGWDIDG